MSKYKQVRINFKDDGRYHNFRIFENIAILKGISVEELLDEIITTEFIESGAYKVVKNFVDADKLGFMIWKEFEFNLSRAQFLKLRKDVLELGEDFFEGSSGNTKVFRYDMEKCYPKIVEFYELEK